MKNSKEKDQMPNEEKVTKHNLRLVWKNDNPKPDGVPCIMIGKLLPHSNTSIPIIRNLPWLEEEMENESDD